MPQRPFTRDQVFLLPPHRDEWIAPDHPVRVVATVIDGLSDAQWAALGIAREPAARGEARYAPAAILAIWVYGFMDGIRSSRDLERACIESLPYRWLSGNQTPDHNTLWRFYKAHRAQFHHLFAHTVKLATVAGLVDWSLQAVDGTKLWAHAAGGRMLTADGLAAVEAAVQTRIAELEAAHDEEPQDHRVRATRLRTERDRLARIAQAQAILAEAEATRSKRTTRQPLKAHTTDPQARHMKAQGTVRPAYNAQAVVAPVPGEAPAPAQPAPHARLIVAVEVRTQADDHGILPLLIDQARERTGRPAAVTLADAGYHSMADLAACEQRAAPVVIPEPAHPRQDHAYGPEAFAFDAATGTLTCPQGHALTRWQSTADAPTEIRYGMAAATCPAKARCCPTTTRGKVIVRSVHAPVRDRHRRWMATEAAQALRTQRSGLVEGVFGAIKLRQAARQVLLRGVDGVRAEWTLLATAYNLKMLARVLGGRLGSGPRARLAPALGRPGPSDPAPAGLAGAR